MTENGLDPMSVVRQLRDNGVTHAVWLPDSETNHFYEQMVAEPSIDIVAITREGEGMPIAAGLWAGGKKPVVIIQNTGMFESGDSIRGMAIDLKIPMVWLIGYRGWKGGAEMADSAGAFTEPILDAWGIDHYLIETDEDAAHITRAFEEAERTNRPVACLIGAEYG